MKFDIYGGWERMGDANCLVMDSPYQSAERSYHNALAISNGRDVGRIERELMEVRVRLGSIRAGLDAGDYNEASVAEEIASLQTRIAALDESKTQALEAQVTASENLEKLAEDVEATKAQYEQIGADDDAILLWIESNQ
jgi:phage shock protein A